MIIMLAGFSELLNTDSLYVHYLFLFAAAFFAFIYLKALKSSEHPVPSRRQSILCRLFSLLFACLITLANYRCWWEISLGQGTPAVFRLGYTFFLFLVIFFGSYVAFSQIFTALLAASGVFFWKKCEKYPKGWTASTVFWGCFLMISGINLAVLLLIKYPGIVEVDSVAQYTEVFHNHYTNWNPFFHTILLKPFMSLGLALFHDVNAGAALYCVFQILCMALIFSFVAKTLFQIGAPGWMILCTVAFYAFMPYHIMYSFTIWKDVLFCGCCTLLCTCAFRLFKKIGNDTANYPLFLLACLGMCLLRSNGLLAIGLLMIFTWKYLWKNQKRMLIAMGIIAVCSLIVKRPVFKALGISNADLVESLSLPTQQIARTVIDYDDFTEEEYALIDSVMEIEKVPDHYRYDDNDPIKNLVRETAKGQPVISSRPAQMLKLYLTLGFRHPDSYLKAWIDISRGYWNGGYDYYVWFNGISRNDAGFHRTCRVPALESVFDHVLGLFMEMPFLRFFMGIGTCVWLHLCCAYYAIIRKDKAGVFIVFPALCAVFTLLLGAPLAYEFRYAYSVFCNLPLVLAVAMRPSL